MATRLSKPIRKMIERKRNCSVWLLRVDVAGIGAIPSVRARNKDARGRSVRKLERPVTRPLTGPRRPVLFAHYYRGVVSENSIVLPQNHLPLFRYTPRRPRASGESRLRSDWVDCSTTTIGRPHEGVVRIFGHYAVHVDRENVLEVGTLDVLEFLESADAGVVNETVQAVEPI